MSRGPEIEMFFDKGVNSDFPDLTSKNLEFTSIENFFLNNRRFEVFKASSSYATFSDPGETPRAFTFLYRLNSSNVDIFIITDAGVYSFVTSPATLTSIGSFTATNTNTIDWTFYSDTSTDSIYFTKLGTNVQKISGGVLSELPATWNDGIGTRKLSARYMISAFDRNILFNVLTDNDQYYPKRVQWSNIFDFEDYEITETKEADFFDLDSDVLDITGAAKHRGFVLVFTRTRIYRLIYLGFPIIFRYEPLYNHIGNLYHRAVVVAKDIVFFIGEDNFYALEGFTPTPIGSDIWNEFEEVNRSSSSDEIIGFSNPREHEVFWKFIRAGSSRFTDYRSEDHPCFIVYNYVENRWSFRATENATAFYSNNIPFRTGLPYSYFNVFWDNEGDLNPVRHYADYPWTKINFVSQNRSSNVVTVVATNHGLITGDKINVIDSVPGSMNAANVEVTYVNSFTFSYPATGPNESASTPGSTDARTYNGNWQILNFPPYEVVGSPGRLALYQQGAFTDLDGFSVNPSFETKEFFFDSIMDTKELTQVKILYEAVGNPTFTIRIGYRQNKKEVITWTDPIAESNITPDNELRFILDRGIRGSLFTIRGEITNDSGNYVTELSALSVFTSDSHRKGAEA